MTAESAADECAENAEDNRHNAAAAADQVQLGSGTVPAEIVDIFIFLSCNEKIVFKSQQIDDPELQREEKVQIAQEIYARNRQTFLMRFGGYLEERHLHAFGRMAIGTEASLPALKDDENGEEMELLLLDYQRKLQTRKRDVKNRRYAAMQQLIEKGEYFGEQEMMKRAPELYQELIGQYLSEEEKKTRDSYDVRNTTFSGILMHTMQQRELDDVLEQADMQNKRKARLSAEEAVAVPAQVQVSAAKDDSESNNSEEEELVCDEERATVCSSNYDDEVPVACRQQWGNFENEQIACSTSRLVQAQPQQTTPKRKPHADTAARFITAGERELLRQEFIGIMHEQFLSGQDADFDYSQVDDNSQLDDLQQLNQDKEDAYFEASDDDEEVASLRRDSVEHMQHTDEESEDELDIYMSHLSKHHSLQQ